VGIDDIEVLDLYSCFPSAVELAAEALGLRTDDARGLTSTGGLPYFGGPGNNYTTHGIAAVTERLRTAAGADPGTAPRLGLATGLGWFVTKHALGLYGTSPPPGGFRRGDTATDQAVIDAGAADVALEVDEATVATVVAATVARDGDGTPTAAPVFARLPDGRQMALAPADEEALLAVTDLDVPGLVGTVVAVQPGPARYRLPTR
jgi:acetyl-CoA C-acetyltransferase